MISIFIINIFILCNYKYISFKDNEFLKQFIDFLFILLKEKLYFFSLILKKIDLNNRILDIVSEYTYYRIHFLTY
jgi:hypothetical protein